MKSNILIVATSAFIAGAVVGVLGLLLRPVDEQAAAGGASDELH